MREVLGWKYFLDLDDDSRDANERWEQGWSRASIVRELCSKMDEEPRILFLAYLAENYKAEVIKAEISRQLESIGSLSIEGDNHRLISAVNILAIAVNPKDKCYRFKRVIDAEEGEFQYYTERTVPLEDYEGGKSEDT